MKMKSLALFAWMLALAGRAQALDTTDLVAIAAMPLAVAAVVDLPDVPTSDVITVVRTLNVAAVPAPQFVEVVRYAPIALVDTTQPRFVRYVTTEYERGIVGNALAVSIADQYAVYGVRDIDVVHPIAYTVVEREILPQVVVTRFQPVSFDPVALVAMPLAVAAVADLTDVSRLDLVNMVTALNLAFVPAPQFVEVVRYSPVVLVDRVAAPSFVTFVTMQVDRGVIGRPLAFAIGDRLRQSSIDDIDINVLSPPPALVVDGTNLVPIVRLPRIVESRSHPHGGPPGQLKKDLGLQTGAEVVHGTKPSRTERPQRAVARPAKSGRADRVVADRVVKQRVAPKPKQQKQVTTPNDEGGRARNTGKAENAGNAGSGAKAGKGKGKGKGKG